MTYGDGETAQRTRSNPLARAPPDPTPPQDTLLNDADYRKALTIVEAHTIRKVQPRYPKKEKPTWAMAEFTREALTPEEINLQMKQLNKRKASVSDKKLALQYFQLGQVNKLLDELNDNDPDKCFEWSLIELDQKIRPLKTGPGRETTTITCFCKRSPRPEVDAKAIYLGLERIKPEQSTSTNKTSPQPLLRPGRLHLESEPVNIYSYHDKLRIQTAPALSDTRNSELQDTSQLSPVGVTYPESSSCSRSEYAVSFQNTVSKYGTAATTISDQQFAQSEVCPEPLLARDQYTEQQQINETAETIMTDNEDFILPPDTKSALISTFAAVLCRNIRYAISDTNSSFINATNEVLPSLLREFSMQLKRLADNENQQLAAVFVRRYRDHITREIDKKLESFKTSSATLKLNQQNPSWKDKIAGWDLNGAEHPLAEDILEERPDNSESIVSYPEAFEFIVSSGPWKRLLAAIKTSLTLTLREGTLISAINKAVLSELSRLPRKSDPTDQHSVKFILDWNPVEFLRQCYPENPNQDLAGVIVIVGDSVDAQATTSEVYMYQTWPLTGVDALMAVQRGLSHEHSLLYELENSEGTVIKVHIENSSTVIEATGSAMALAELGEQLAWLGAACRQAKGDQLSYCTPVLEVKGGLTGYFTMKYIETCLDADADDSPKGDGTCWHAIFRNPTIVPGYPMLARTKKEKGLEIPLNMMASLIEAAHATDFDGGILIKGFSSILIPTARIENSILWHLEYKEDGSRMAYCTGNERCLTSPGPDSVDLSLLKVSRNFLGWAPSAILRAGTKEINYDQIRHSRLDFASAGCALKSVTISAGLSFPGIGNISGGTSFGKGIKDHAIWLSRTGTYRQMITFAGGINVVLYDTEMEMAWVLDGASALLHLARTSLVAEPHVSTRLFELEDFTHANPKPSRGNAAIFALMNVRNQELQIDEESSTHIERKTIDGITKEERIQKIVSWNFKDLVIQTWHSLEQMIDHQMKILKSPDVDIRLPGRDLLEGFGFMDIVEGNFPIRPQQLALKKSGKAWLNFTKTIGALVLFGTGFGNLVEPLNTTTMCKRWREVPTREEYLVICLSTLNKIFTRYSVINSEPILLAGGIYWSGQNIYKPCNCQLSSCCERAQSCSKLPASTKANHKPFEFVDGAVVFGSKHRRKLPWSRKGPEENTIHDWEDPIPGSKSHSSSVSSSGNGRSDSWITDSAITSDTTARSSGSVVSKSEFSPEITSSNAEHSTETSVLNSSPGLSVPPMPASNERLMKPGGQRGGFGSKQTCRLRRKPKFSWE